MLSVYWSKNNISILEQKRYPYTGAKIVSVYWSETVNGLLEKNWYRYTGAKLNIRRSFSVHGRVTSEWCEEKNC